MAGFKEYQMMFSLNASMEAGFQSTFQASTSEIARMQKAIEQNNRTAADITAYQKQETAIEKTRAKIDLYQKQLENLKSATGNTKKEEAELANAIAAKEKQLSDSEKALTRQETKLGEMGDALRQAGVNTEDLATAQSMLADRTEALKASQMEVAGSTQGLSSAMEGLKSAMMAVGVTKGLEEVYGVLKECSAAATDYETAMAAVKRTVGGNDDFISELSGNFKELSTVIPITAEELASIATTAGQLGIAQDNVETFTQVMALLATTTDLTADNAATMLAQFANITGTTDYERLGSTVAALGDATATTASKVVDMSQGMAAAASLAGMSETDILAIAAAVGSLGIEAASGSTSMSTLISTLYKATETGDKLEDFAAVAGMSAEQFKTAWGENAVGAMDAFIQGLNDTERNGRSAVVILDELGITNVRQTKAILGLASAGDLLSSTIAQANNAWDSNTALTEKAGIMYDTTEAKLTMLQNAANNVSVAVGDALNPAVSGVAGAFTDLLNPVADFISENPQIIQGLTATVGALGIATAAVTAYEAKVKLATIASKIFSSTTPLGWIAGGAVAIGAVVTALGYLSSAAGDTGASFEELQEEYDKLSADFEKNQNIIDLVDQYKELSKELDSIRDVDPGDIELKATLEKNGVTRENLNLINELKDKIDTKTGELKQILQISGADDITDDDLEMITTLANNVEDGDHELMQQLALLGADDISDEDMARLRELAASITEDEATLSQNLALTGFENYDDMKAASELPLESKTAEILVEMKEQGYTDVTQKLSDIGSQVVSTQQQLDGARTTLDELQGKAESIQQTLGGKLKKSDREALESELTEINEQIETQEKLIKSLEDTHGDLVAQYDATAEAARAVKDKEDELTATKEALAEAMGGVVAGSAEEVEALYDQAAATAEVNNALIRQQLYANIAQQSKKYVVALDDLSEAEGKSAVAMDKVTASQEYAGMKVEEINAHFQSLLRTLDEMQAAEGFDPSSMDYQSTIDEVETLRNLFMGVDEDLNQYAGDVASWVSSFSYLGTSETAWGRILEDMNADVGEYKENVEAAKKTQNDFLEAMANGVLTGAVKIEEVKARLEDAWKDEENAGELVAGVIDYINDKLAEQTEAAEQAAEANELLAESGLTTSSTASEQAQAVQGTIDKINDLKKAYEEAYQAAKESMAGQFSLFEKSKEIKTSKTLNKDLKGYKEGLESQTAYMEQYAENYAKVSEMVSKSTDEETAKAFMSTLTDGSAESAQTLANLAAATDTQLGDILTAYSDNQVALDEFATKVAESETNFTETMAELQAELETTVQAMNFSEEAAANAKASLDAFIAAAEGYEGKAAAAYGKVARAASNALRFNFSYDPYASGTENATAGVHLVGEEGPELVMFKGGERVLNAQETAQALSKPVEALPAVQTGGSTTSESGGNTYNVSVSIPSINAAGMDADSLMKSISEKLRDAIIDTMEEYEEDARRTRY